MNKFPSKWTMLFSILLLAVLSSLKFSRKLDAQHFQLKFDWKKERVIHSLEGLRVDSVSYNFLSLSGIETASVPDNQNTFSLILENGKKYYFRFINFDHNNKAWTFNAVEWITGVPDATGARVSLNESDIPLVENNGPTIVTIGDDLLIKDEAKYFRRKIAAIKDVRFDGRIKDVFNYKHNADYGKTLTGILNELNSVPDGEFYIIFLKPQENLTEKEFEKDAKAVIEKLFQRKRTKKIIWISMPFTKNAKRNKQYKTYNNLISQLKQDKLVILDTYSAFSNEKKEFLMPDSISLNKTGYEKLAGETVKLLK